MRINASDNTVLPFYSDPKLKYSNQCNDCEFVISVPIGKAPAFQLIFDEVVPNPVALFFGCNGNLFNQVALTVETKQVNGVDKFFITFDGNVALPVGSYDIRLLFVGAAPFVLYSEEFCVTAKDHCWLMKWSNDCDNAMGCFSTGYANQFYIDEIDFEKSITEKVIDEKVNGNGEKQTTFISSKKIASFNILGNSFLSESLANVDAYDNVTLVNLTTLEEVDMKEIEISDSSGDSCQYPINISFVKSIVKNDKCCDISDPFIENACEETPPIECDGFEVTVSEANGVLTYTAINQPTGTASPQWSINGSYSGNGSSISVGVYGTYSLALVSGGCTASDSFIYTNPCENINLDVTVSGPVIAGSATGDDNIVISICNSLGVEIGTGLPFTVPESEGDGNFSIKAVGDECEKQIAVYVKVTTPFICEQEVSIAVSGAVITGSSTGCTDPLTSEFIELENASGTLTIVSNTNTHTATETGIYWYNADCNGCVERRYRLVIVDNCEDQEPIEVVVTGIVKTMECEPPTSGDQTKVELAQ